MRNSNKPHICTRRSILTQSLFRGVEMKGEFVSVDFEPFKESFELPFLLAKRFHEFPELTKRYAAIHVEPIRATD